MEIKNKEAVSAIANANTEFGKKLYNELVSRLSIVNPLTKQDRFRLPAVADVIKQRNCVNCAARVLLNGWNYFTPWTTSERIYWNIRPKLHLSVQKTENYISYILLQKSVLKINHLAIVYFLKAKNEVKECLKISVKVEIFRRQSHLVSVQHQRRRLHGLDRCQGLNGRSDPSWPRPPRRWASLGRYVI